MIKIPTLPTKGIYIEKWIEEYSVYPNGERYFIKKYQIGRQLKTGSNKKKKKELQLNIESGSETI